MATLAAPRKTEPEFFTKRAYKMKATTKIFPGSIVVITISTGLSEAGKSASGLRAVGIADSPPDKSGVWDSALVADVNVMTAEGASGGEVGHWLDNDSVAAVTQAHVGSDCDVKDNTVVTSDSTSRSVCGEVLKVDATKGVLVKFK